MRQTNCVKDGEIFVFVDGKLFSKQTILKCLYWYGDKFHTNYFLDEKGNFSISLKPLAISNVKPDELELYLQKMERDLIDFQLRDTIVKETHNIRDLLVAKAFSNGEFDEVPPGDVSDPVGFNPNIQ